MGSWNTGQGAASCLIRARDVHLGTALVNASTCVYEYVATMYSTEYWTRLSGASRQSADDPL